MSRLMRAFWSIQGWVYLERGARSQSMRSRIPYLSQRIRSHMPERWPILRCDGLIFDTERHHIRLWSSWAYLERGLKRLNTQLQEAHLRSRSRSHTLIPTCDFEVSKVDGGGEGQRNRTSFVSTETLETDAPHAILLLLFWDIYSWAYLER